MPETIKTPKKALNLNELLAQKGLAGATGAGLVKEEIRKQLGTQAPPTSAAPILLPEVKAGDLQTLKTSFQEDVIYTVPLEDLDFEDMTFYMRRPPQEVIKEEETKQTIQSLKEVGQKVPIITQFNDMGKLQIIDGWRRSLSLREAGLPTAKVQIARLDPKTAALVAAVTNFDRVDVPGYNKALYVQRLCNEFNYKKEEVAKLLGYSQVYIYKILSIFTYPELVEALKDDKFTLAGSVRIGEAAKKVSPEEFPRLVNRLKGKSGDLSKEIEKGIEVFSEKKSIIAGSKGRAIKKIFQKEEDGRLIFKTVIHPKKTTHAEIDVLLSELKRFQEELLQVKKGLPKK